MVITVLLVAVFNVVHKYGTISITSSFCGPSCGQGATVAAGETLMLTVSVTGALSDVPVLPELEGLKQSL